MKWLCSSWSITTSHQALSKELSSGAGAVVQLANRPIANTFHLGAGLWPGATLQTQLLVNGLEKQ